MKIIIVLAVCVAATMCAPRGNPANSEILKQPALLHEEEHDDLGQFSLRYVTADGTTVTQRGYLISTADGKDVVLILEGEYTFVGPDGKTYTTKYTSDVAGGYKASGAHFPISPEPEPIPEPLLL